MKNIKTYNNADYYQCGICESTDTDINKVCDCNVKEEITAIHNKLLISDSHGIYIPQIFYKDFDFKQWGLKKEDYAALDDPSDEWYWDAWSELLSNAEYKDDQGNIWYLEQNGDLWAFLNIHYSEKEI